MYYELATKMVLPSTGSSYTPAVQLLDANAVDITFDVIHFDGTDVVVTVEIGNDLSNWLPWDASSNKSSAGSFTFTSTGIAARYLRLSITGSKSIVTACVETKRL